MHSGSIRKFLLREVLGFVVQVEIMSSTAFFISDIRQKIHYSFFSFRFLQPTEDLDVFFKTWMQLKTLCT